MRARFPSYNLTKTTYHNRLNAEADMKIHLYSNELDLEYDVCFESSIMFKGFTAFGTLGLNSIREPSRERLYET